VTIPDRSFAIEAGRIGFLLIHGLGGTPNEHRFIAAGLARHGYTVHCPQLAGHCGSYENLRATGWKDWYASSEAAHERLCRSCDVVIVGGLSMGALLALHLAAKRPDKVHGTVLLAPTLWLDGWGVPWYAALFKLVRQKWFANLLQFSERQPYGIKDPRVRALVEVAIHSGDSSQVGQLSNPGGVMLEMRWLVECVKRELASIKQPALIVHPRDDDRASLGNAAYLQMNLGGLVDTCVLDDSYHVITIDQQRTLVVHRAAAFASWLAERVKLREQATPTIPLLPWRR
jgi:carboxylesterase